MSRAVSPKDLSGKRVPVVAGVKRCVYGPTRNGKRREFGRDRAGVSGCPANSPKSDLAVARSWEVINFQGIGGMTVRKPQHKLVSEMIVVCTRI